MLRKIRIVVSVVCFVWLTFYFLDFTGISGVNSILPEIQIAPALFSMAIVVLGIWVALTLLFGRVYCSSVCPLGVFQDVVIWLSRRLNRKKHYGFAAAHYKLRWIVLAVAVVCVVFGFLFLPALVDPYSAYGRMVTNVFKPLYMAGNNGLAWVFMQFDNYYFYYVDLAVRSLLAFAVGLLTFLSISFLAYRYGRLYCNTICPVGTILGFLSRYAFFKVRINQEKCNGCGLCALKCKASCIDSKNHQVDYSRCINCFDCVENCHRNALSYTPILRRTNAEGDMSGVSDSRRRFLATVVATAVAVPETMAEHKIAETLTPYKAYKRQNPLSPPGSLSFKHLNQACTSCHLCVTKCPSHVLKPSFLEYGVEGMMQPTMDFEKGFCNFDCTVCSEVCPNGAILPLTVEEKHVTQVGRVVFLVENCIVNTDETNCGACSEHCPTQAVTMVPYKNGLTIPHVNPDICVGCGGCEYVCPVRPFRVIHIEGNAVHQQAQPFQEAEKKEVEVDDFGF